MAVARLTERLGTDRLTASELQDLLAALAACVPERAEDPDFHFLSSVPLFVVSGTA